MSTTEQIVFQKEMQIEASPETVWEFLVDPEKVARWKGRLAETFEPAPGGAFRIEVLPGTVASGEFVELDPPHRVVFTWGWEDGEDGPGAVPPGSSTIEIELTPQGNGTLLRFTHRDLPSPESAQSHGHGWDHYLGRLVTAAAGGDPGIDPWIDTRGASA
jgi:uncharacterized protein YndB with AHSA1/START domain